MTNFDRQLADHIKTQLDKAKLDLRPKIERRWLPRFEVNDLEEPRICIAPRVQARTPGSRTSWNRRHTIQVALMAKIPLLPRGQIDDSRIDRLIDIAESIIDTICDADPLSGASLTAAETDPLYDLAAMENPGIFRSVLTFTYTRNGRSV